MMTEAMILGSLTLVMALVLILPFSVRWIEEELEIFLFFMGALAVTLSGNWERHLIWEALTEPIKISLAVLVFGVVFRWSRPWIRRGVSQAVGKIGLGPFLVALVMGLGVLSSVVTAIISALILVEVISGLQMSKEKERALAVLACYSIGLGAALTPIGEPLSTIVVAKLAGPPYHADFFFLARLLWPWIGVGIAALGFLAVKLVGPNVKLEESLTQDAPENFQTIVMRAVKVFVFISALVLLGRGFTPIVDRYLLILPPSILYWVNMVSAVLDNATLAAAEVSPKMPLENIEYLLLGLLISGGMLIPGNIPNIICASKLGIKSRDWAKLGVPLGLILMTICFILLEALG